MRDIEAIERVPVKPEYKYRWVVSCSDGDIYLKSNTDENFRTNPKYIYRYSRYQDDIWVVGGAAFFELDNAKRRYLRLVDIDHSEVEP